MTKATSLESTLIWIDLEMSGLIVEKDVILEIATLVTNGNLELLAQGPNLVIGQPKELLENMNEWCVQQHSKSGLFQESLQSLTSLEQAEEATMQFLRSFVVPGQGILCGNSVWQDRIFIQRYMPKLYSLLHYKIVDVSSVKEIVRRWYPTDPAIEFKKSDTHRALPDILESIDELRHYRHHFFRQASLAS